MGAATDFRALVMLMVAAESGDGEEARVLGARIKGRSRPRSRSRKADQDRGKQIEIEIKIEKSR